MTGNRKGSGEEIKRKGNSKGINKNTKDSDKKITKMITGKENVRHVNKTKERKEMSEKNQMEMKRKTRKRHKNIWKNSNKK